MGAGRGVEAILPAVIERVPPPPGDPGKPLRALLFDAYHDEYRGVICLLEIVDGGLRRGDRVTAAASQDSYDILEVLLLPPKKPAPCQCLSPPVLHGNPLYCPCLQPHGISSTLHLYL